MIRAVAVGALLIDAVLYARYGIMPSLAWLAAALVTAKFMPRVD